MLCLSDDISFFQNPKYLHTIYYIDNIKQLVSPDLSKNDFEILAYASENYLFGLPFYQQTVQRSESCAPSTFMTEDKCNLTKSSDVLCLNLPHLKLYPIFPPWTNKHTHDSLRMADVWDGAVQGDPVTDINVEAVLPVGLVHPVSVRQGERLPLFTITCVKHTQSARHHIYHIYQEFPTSL